jgi:hypothetical protein
VLAGHYTAARGGHPRDLRRTCGGRGPLWRGRRGGRRSRLLRGAGQRVGRGGCGQAARLPVCTRPPLPHVQFSFAGLLKVWAGGEVTEREGDGAAGYRRG